MAPLVSAGAAAADPLEGGRGISLSLSPKRGFNHSSCESMGFASFAPPLDDHGNSVKGVGFFSDLVNSFTFHMFDNTSSVRSGLRKDPRLSQGR